MFLETSQLSWKTNPKTPSCWKAGRASTSSRTKKNASRTKIPAASTVSAHRRRSSGSRAAERRSSALIDAASMALAARLRRLDRRPVALQAVDLRLGLRVHRRGQGRVLELRRDLLARPLGVLQPRLHALGLA